MGLSCENCNLNSLPVNVYSWWCFMKKPTRISNLTTAICYQSLATPTIKIFRLILWSLQTSRLGQQRGVCQRVANHLAKCQVVEGRVPAKFLEDGNFMAIFEQQDHSLVTKFLSTGKFAIVDLKIGFKWFLMHLFKFCFVFFFF